MSDDKYLNRPNSRSILYLMEEYDITKKEAAYQLFVTVERFKYKLVKNDFTMHDVMRFLRYISDSCEVTWEALDTCVGFYQEAREAKKERRDELKRKARESSGNCE